MSNPTAEKKVHWAARLSMGMPRPGCNKWIGGLRAIGYQYSTDIDKVTCRKCRKAMGLAA